jgi:hypothetical protein
VLGVLGLAAALPLRTLWREHGHALRILPSWYAKEACTCLHVLGRDEAQCHEMVRQSVSIGSFEHDAARGEVRVKAFGQTSRAVYEGPRFGCRLVE